MNYNNNANKGVKNNAFDDENTTQKVNYIGYSRVSTLEQNDDRQYEILENHQCTRIFSDKASGKDALRPGLTELLSYVRQGDVVIIESYSRLARSSKDLIEIIETLDSKGVGVISVKENFNTKTPHGKLMLNIFASLAEFERECLLERQREGIAIAKAEGRYKGKQEKEIPNLFHYKNLVDSKHITVKEACKSLKISRSTYYRRTKDV